MADNKDLDWIKLHRPEWVGTPQFKWLSKQLDNPDVLKSVKADIQGGVQDIQQVNTNANYQVQQASKPPAPSNEKTYGPAQKPALSGLHFVTGNAVEPGGISVERGVNTKPFEDYLNTLSPDQRLQVENDILTSIKGGGQFEGAPNSDPLHPMPQAGVESLLDRAKANAAPNWIDRALAGAAAIGKPQQQPQTQPPDTETSSETPSPWEAVASYPQFDPKTGRAIQIQRTKDVSPNQWSFLDQSLGLGPGGAQAAYNAEHQAYLAAQKDQARARFQVEPGEQRPSGLDPANWVYQKTQAITGSWSFLLDNVIEPQYVASHGGFGLPGDLKKQLLDGIASSPQLQQQLTAASDYLKNPSGSRMSADQAAAAGVTPSELLGSNSYLGQMIGNYDKAHVPRETRTAKMAENFNNQWFDAFGEEAPSRITSSPQSMIQYSNAIDRTRSMWQSNFGKEPTVNDLEFAMGKSDDDLKQYVDTQPSRVANVDIGQYKDYLKAGNDLSNQLFMRPLDSRLIGLMQAQS